MTWVAGEFVVKTTGGERRVAGWIKGHFALDFRPYWQRASDRADGTVGWCLTHLVTGYSVFGLLMGLERAQAVAEEVADWANWEHVDPLSVRFLSGKKKELQERHFPAICHTDDLTPPWCDLVFEDRDGALTPVLNQ